jgi:uncharacterized protein
MKYIKRQIEDQIKKYLFSGKALIILGARQVGKTTMVKSILDNTEKYKTVSINGDDPDDVDQIYNRGLEHLKGIFYDADIIFIDEAQKIPAVGNTIKMLVDYYGISKQVIVSGSSSINILENTSESLTGRKITFLLYGLTLKEISNEKSIQQIDKCVENYLLYGTYPEIFTSKGFDKKELLLDQITDSNLYKDILGYQNVKNPIMLRNLLKLVSLQVGQEVSTNELANKLGIDKNTVEKYLDLLERAFIIFRLTAYNKDKRREISKNRKVFFYDLGIRNALINDFRDFTVRDDIGRLWENFVVLELLKQNKYLNHKKEMHFWRTYKGEELNLVEVAVDEVRGYEIKYNKKQPIGPASWNHGTYEIINRSNYLSFIIK